MIKVSVIVPVYNTKINCLKKCLDSLCNQTLKEIEIIIVDDGSTNLAGSVCDEYEKRCEKIQVIHKKNEGVAAARNAGMAVAIGKWITFVDSDDWCSNDMCEKAFEKAEECKSDIMIFANYTVKENGKIEKNSYFEKSYEFLNEEMKEEAELKTLVRRDSSFSFNPPNDGMGATWGKMIDRNFLEKTGIRFEVELLRSQDVVFYLYLFEQAKKISYCDEAYYYYRHDLDSNSRRYRPDAYKIFVKVLKKQKAFIDMYKKNQHFREIFAIRILNVIGTCLETDFLHKDNKEKFFAKCRRMRIMLKLEPIKSSLKQIDCCKNKLGIVRKLQIKLLKYKMTEIYILLVKLNKIIGYKIYKD